MLTIVRSRFLFERLESITETSLEQVEINRHTDDIQNVRGSLTISARVEAAETALDVLWETIEDSSGGVDIARRIEASLEKNIRCAAIVRIHRKSSQFSALSILPQTQCLVIGSNFD